MDVFSLQCIEIEHYEGYDLVVLLFTSNDPTIGAGSTVNFTITDTNTIQIGKYYDLNLNEITDI